MLYAPKVSTCLKAQNNQRRPAMKKVSTAATKQSRNISQQRLTIGLDLGDRNSCYCVLDEAGRIQLEQRVRTTAKALQEVFGGMPRSRVALEIGTHSPWISRLLRELEHEVIVANARKVRLIGENRKKDDRLEAQTPGTAGADRSPVTVSGEASQCAGASRSGTAARAQAVGEERSADAYHQRRRSLPANVVGAGSTTYLGTIRYRL